VPDADLDPDQRELLGEYLTPVVGLDGERAWPVDELGEAAVEAALARAPSPPEVPADGR
jgi:hypothetical protein